MAEDTPTSDKTDELRNELVKQLEGTNRLERQEASRLLAVMAQQDAALVVPATSALVSALTLPEAQTRWECLNALSEVAQVRPEVAQDAFVGAEDALFDEESSLVRVAAFRFFARLGAQSPAYSRRAWPLMGEAIQCYHGDAGYREMVASLRDFAQGCLAAEVREALAERMEYDAKYGRGFVRSHALEICALAEKG